jgi:hypothetical protein
MTLLGKRLVSEEPLDPNDLWNELDFEIASTPFQTTTFAGYGFKPAVPVDILHLQSKNSIERASFCILPSTSKPNEYLIKFKLLPKQVPVDLNQLYSKVNTRPSANLSINFDQRSSSNQAETSQRESLQDRNTKRAEERTKVENYRFERATKNQEKIARHAKRKFMETGRKAQEAQHKIMSQLNKETQRPKAHHIDVRLQSKKSTPHSYLIRTPRETPPKQLPALRSDECLQDPTTEFMPKATLTDVPLASDHQQRRREGPTDSFMKRPDSIFKEGRKETDLKPHTQSRDNNFELFRYLPGEVNETDNQEFIDSERLDLTWHKKPVLCQVYMFKDISIHRFDREIFSELHSIRNRYSEAYLHDLALSIKTFQSTLRKPQTKKLLHKYECFASFDKVLTNLYLDYPLTLQHVEALNPEERSMLLSLSNAKFELIRKGSRLSDSDSNLKIMIGINNALKDLLAEIYANFDAAKQTEAIYREFMAYLKYRKGVSIVLTLQQLEDQSVFLLKAVYEEHHRKLVRGKLEDYDGNFLEYLKVEFKGSEWTESMSSEVSDDDEGTAAKFGMSAKELHFFRQYFSSQKYTFAKQMRPAPPGPPRHLPSAALVRSALQRPDEVAEFPRPVRVVSHLLAASHRG